MSIVFKVLNGDAQFGGKVYVSDNIVNQKGSPILDASDVDLQDIVFFRQSGTAAAETRFLCCVRGAAATVLEVGAGCLTANTNSATVDVDVKKNGTTILSSVITLDDADGNRDLVAGTISTSAAVQDDVFEVVAAVSARTGTLGQGLFAYMKLNQDYSS